MRNTHVLNRKGSLFVVIMVAAVLGIMGGIAVMMSTSFGRTSHHDRLVFDAKAYARQATEEAAVLINNGSVDTAIAKAVADVDAMEITDQIGKLPGSPLADLGAQKPRVYVKATLMNDDPAYKGWRISARDQWNQMNDSMGKSKDADVQAFIKRLDGQNSTKYDGTEGFWNETNQTYDTRIETAEGEGTPFKGTIGRADVKKWGPKVEQDKKNFQEVAAPTATDPTATKKLYWTYLVPDGTPSNPLQKAMMDCFHTLFTPVSAPGLPAYLETEPTPTGGAQIPNPDAAAFKATWTLAIQEVAKDAASKSKSCGGNPSLAMAHMVGDLKTGKAIASAAEVAATKDFLIDEEMAAKTFLVEITASMGYESKDGQGKRKGNTAFRQYRIFQQVDIGAILAELATKCAENTINSSALTAQDFANQWPGNEPLGSTGVNWDPEEFMHKHVFEELPRTVGSQLYPFGVGEVSWSAEPDQVAKTDGDS